MWYIALIFWIIMFICNIFLCRSYPKNMFGISRGVNIICALIIAITCCDDDVFTLGGFIGWCVFYSSFVPFYLSAKKQQIITYALIINMLMEITAAIWVCIARSLAKPIPQTLQLTGILASNTMLYNLEWLAKHPDITTDDAPYFTFD